MAGRAYFAYGSNMLTARLMARVPGAGLLGTGQVAGRRLLWHKASRDGSGKCDCAPGAPQDRVWGVLYAIPEQERPVLDRIEGLGSGYDAAEMLVATASDPVPAWCYVATDTDPTLRPYSWYRALVLAGAREHRLPPAYCAALGAAEAIADPDAARHAANMALIPPALRRLRR